DPSLAPGATIPTMSSDARRTLWVGVLAGIFLVAALSSRYGLLWNEDLLYLANLGVLVWTARETSAPVHPRLRRAAKIATLLALTTCGGIMAGEGPAFWGVENWLGLVHGWLALGLAAANYLAHVWLAIAAYRATAREHRHPIRLLLEASALALVLVVLWVS